MQTLEQSQTADLSRDLSKPLPPVAQISSIERAMMRAAAGNAAKARWLVKVDLWRAGCVSEDS